MICLLLEASLSSGSVVVVDSDGDPLSVWQNEFVLVVIVVAGLRARVGLSLLLRRGQLFALLLRGTVERLAGVRVAWDAALVGEFADLTIRIDISVPKNKFICIVPCHNYSLHFEKKY
jgi:hypothetical protein